MFRLIVNCVVVLFLVIDLFLNVLMLHDLFTMTYGTWLVLELVADGNL